MTAASPGAPARPRLGVLLSGGGRTLVNLLERIERGSLHATVGLVLASRACGGVERARERAVPADILGRDEGAPELEARLRGAGIDWVVLAGYLRLLPVPRTYEGRVVNIHPALLPSFGGPGMYGDRVHAAVLEAGCKVSGCTVHLCDERYDTGPIVLQRACEVRDDDTPATLAARVFELEREAYPEALSRLLSGRVVVEGRRTRTVPA